MMMRKRAKFTNSDLPMNPVLHQQGMQPIRQTFRLTVLPPACASLVCVFANPPDVLRRRILAWKISERAGPKVGATKKGG